METPATESDFVMHGARAAVSGGMLHIEELVKAIELAVVQNTGLAFDLAKTLIESACKTILAERGGSFDKDDDLPKLFKMARQVVPFLPASLQELSKMKFSVSSTTSNGYRFADLGPANNPSGWAGMLKVKSPDGTTLGYILLYTNPLPSSGAAGTVFTPPFLWCSTFDDRLEGSTSASKPLQNHDRYQLGAPIAIARNPQAVTHRVARINFSRREERCENYQMKTKLYGSLAEW